MPCGAQHDLPRPADGDAEPRDLPEEKGAPRAAQWSPRRPAGPDTGPDRRAWDGNPYAALAAILGSFGIAQVLSWSALDLILSAFWAVHGLTGDTVFHGTSVPWLPRNAQDLRAFHKGA